jgi:hypothetical protein
MAASFKSLYQKRPIWEHAAAQGCVAGRSRYSTKTCLEVMDPSGPSPDTPGSYTYSAQVSATRPANDYTARIVPHHPDALVALEAGQIVWQR